MLLLKYLITALVVTIVGEAARRSDRLGGLIAALPLVTILTLIRLHLEQLPQERIANHAWYTFWYVVPTLPMFLAFPWLLGRLGFWPSLLVSAAGTIGLYRVFALAMAPLGVRL